MTNALLEGLVVVDLAAPPAAMTGAILADLGAQVIKVGGAPDLAWDEKKVCVGADQLAHWLAQARIVIDTPYWPDAPTPDPASAPHAAWVRVTPFGLDGPRALWRATDLGTMAASGNMYCTGDPDRAPVRPSQPASYAHGAPEAAFAALSAVYGDIRGVVDVAVAEVISVANMGGAGRFASTGERGGRRGANIGRTREIWPTSDGYVSFGLRGGKARVPSLELLTRLVAADGIDASALTARDWNEFAPNSVSDEELAAIEAPVAEFFARHTMTELYEIAVEHNWMLAPINGPADILASAQLAAREFFETSADGLRVPASPCHTRTNRGVSDCHIASSETPPGGGPWAGVRILEFGSGAAGPISTRYFVEHGATVLRIESKSRPDFLRVYALGPDNPDGLNAAPMFDALNVAKRDFTVNLKHPDAVALVERLVVEWADAIVENFAPKAMRGFGLDIDSIWELKPDLVMASACLNGQTGPHKNYPGFGGQGSALSGWNFVTGWPDREPVGPHGTITDSLAPRFVAAALAAGLIHRRTTGHGVYIDVSQVEAAIYSLTPWLVEFQTTGAAPTRHANADPAAALCGVYACAAEEAVADRWIAIRCANDDEWRRLCDVAGIDASASDRDEAVEAWTCGRSRAEIAEELQSNRIEAVPVSDLGDVFLDHQLAHRNHFVFHNHPYLGEVAYERNGVRFPPDFCGYDRGGPTLGQDNQWALHDLLGLNDTEIAALIDEGSVE
ncbi:MAG: CoA transferase [Acidimicrobiia bacterium]